MISIKNTLQNNNYPTNITSLGGGNIRVKEEDQKISTVCLPYIKKRFRRSVVHITSSQYSEADPRYREIFAFNA